VRQLSSWYIGAKPSVWQYSSKAFKKFLNGLTVGSYDVAVFMEENAAMFGRHLPAQMPKILVRHNLDSESIKVKKDSLKSYFSTVTAKYLSRRFDRWTLKLFSKTTIGTESEKKILQSRGNPLSVSLLPTITRFDVSEPSLSKRSVDHKSLKAAFVGDFNYRPNVEAIDWFIKCEAYLSPEILEKLEVVLVGRSPPDIPSRCKIKFQSLGFVDDLFSVLLECHFAIIPVVSGSGVKVKALTLLASGLPVVSTSEGVQGINAKNEVDCLIADDQRSFSEAMERLAVDPGLGDYLQKNAYKLIREGFSARRQNEILSEIIGDAIKIHGIKRNA
jgi:glycosyltransferase involved in cell wall biosynthesis